LLIVVINSESVDLMLYVQNPLDTFPHSFHVETGKLPTCCGLVGDTWKLS